jgi:YfiH family protein
VRENRRLLAEALGHEPADVVIGRQVHGAELATHEGPQRPSPFAQSGSPIPEVDGHVISGSGAALVFVADCLPVALSGPGGVAILHCGWRGLAAGIVAAGARAVEARAAAIGPGIGPCCYEVGEEVLEAFTALGDDLAEGHMLDLAAVAARLLARSGVDQVEVAGLCTSCERELLFSHRRDGERTGRQAGIAWPRES